MPKSSNDFTVINFPIGSRGNFVASMINASLGNTVYEVSEYGDCHDTARNIFDGSIMPDNADDYDVILTHFIDETLEGLKDAGITNYKIINITIEEDDYLECTHNWVYKFIYGNNPNKPKRYKKHKNFWLKILDDTIRTRTDHYVDPDPQKWDKEQYAHIVYFLSLNHEKVHIPKAYELPYKRTLDKDSLLTIVTLAGGKWNPHCEKLYHEYVHSQQGYLFGLTEKEILEIVKPSQLNIMVHSPAGASVHYFSYLIYLALAGLKTAHQPKNFNMHSAENPYLRHHYCTVAEGKLSLEPSNADWLASLDFVLGHHKNGTNMVMTHAKPYILNSYKFENEIKHFCVYFDNVEEAIHATINNYYKRVKDQNITDEDRRHFEKTVFDQADNWYDGIVKLVQSNSYPEYSKEKPNVGYTVSYFDMLDDPIKHIEAFLEREIPQERKDLMQQVIDSYNDLPTPYELIQSGLIRNTNGLYQP